MASLASGTEPRSGLSGGSTTSVAQSSGRSPAHAASSSAAMADSDATTSTDHSPGPGFSVPGRCLVRPPG